MDKARKSASISVALYTICVGWVDLRLISQDQVQKSTGQRHLWIIGFYCTVKKEREMWRGHPIQRANGLITMASEWNKTGYIKWKSTVVIQGLLIGMPGRGYYSTCLKSRIMEYTIQP